MLGYLGPHLDATLPTIHAVFDSVLAEFCDDHGQGRRGFGPNLPEAAHANCFNGSRSGRKIADHTKNAVTHTVEDHVLVQVVAQHVMNDGYG